MGAKACVWGVIFVVNFKGSWEWRIQMKQFIDEKCSKMLMNLQMFGDGDGAGSSNGGEVGSNEGDEPISFKNQSEFDSAVDKRMSKALETAQSKWEKDTQERIDKARNDGLTEGQRMAQMSEDERKQAEQAQQEEAAAKREAALVSRELRLEALEELTKRDLPKELVDAVVLTAADACKNSIEAIEKSFNTAVEQGVKKALAVSAQGVTPHNNGGSTTKEVGSYGKSLAEKNGVKKTESNYF